MTVPSSPTILDVTLRDGSYLVDFQFTADDTSTIVAALEATGIGWIEVGHGLGLNAANAGKGDAAATDEEYLDAAARAAEQARWGMFFIPGIGREEDLRQAARYGMDFVRIGADVTNVQTVERFVKLAKELGLLVSYNAMKSYAVCPDEFASCAATVRGWGADLVCLVDSAGGMYPEDVRAYLQATQAASDISLGFHGHDNLSLAMANTLAAVEDRAVLVDSSLQGIGRSAGNTITEVLVAILKRRGLVPEIDLNTVMDLGQSLIQPALRRRGMGPLAVTSGMARFHSSYTPKLKAYAAKYGLDIRDLITRLCEEDQVDAPDDLLEHLGQELATSRVPRVFTTRVFGPDRPKPEQGSEALRAVLREIRSRAFKHAEFSALNVAVADTPLSTIQVSGNVQNTVDHVVGSAVIGSQSQLTDVLQLADGIVDAIMLDVDRKPFGPQTPAATACDQLGRSLLITYSDTTLWVEAIESQVVRLADEVLEDVPLVVVGDHAKSRRLAMRLAERGADVVLLQQSESAERDHDFRIIEGSLDVTELRLRALSAESGRAGELLRRARLVVVWTKGEPWFGASQTRFLERGAYLLDCSVGAILPEGVRMAKDRGVLPVRIDIWPVLAGQLSAAHESSRVRHEAFGWGKIADIPVVAGGAMGERGDLIVDSIQKPTRVIGISDGNGRIRFDYSTEDAERVRRVSLEIARRMVAQ